MLEISFLFCFVLGIWEFGERGGGGGGGGGLVRDLFLLGGGSKW